LLNFGRSDGVPEAVDLASSFGVGGVAGRATLFFDVGVSWKFGEVSRFIFGGTSGGESTVEARRLAGSEA